MSIEIKRVTKENRNEIERLFHKTLLDSFDKEAIDKSHYDEIAVESKLHLNCIDSDIKSNGRDEFYLTASVDDKIVGIIGYGSANDVIRNHLKADFKICPEMKGLYILPSYQKRGIGSMLIKKIITSLKDNSYDQYCFDCGFKLIQPLWTKKFGQASLILKDYYCLGADHMIWHIRL